MVDYNSEVDKLASYKPEDSSTYWKPSAGQYDVIATSELQLIDPFVDDKTGEKNPRASLGIDVNGKSVSWTMGLGKTMASTYGQLCNLGKHHDNKLIGVKFKVVVSFDGTRNTYTIVI